MDQEFVDKIETIVQKAISHANIVLTNIEIVDQDQLHETIRVTGKFTCKDALDSSFTLILPSRKTIERTYN